MGSNKDKKYRNRSRSRSKSSKRKDERSHKKKSHKKNHKKKKSNKSLSKSRSRSRSYDNRIQRKEKNSIKNDLKDIKLSPENKQEQKERPKMRMNFGINKSLLSNIIQGQQKTNVKLDTNQLKETEIKLKQIDKTGNLNPKLMTEFLSSKEAQQLAKQDYQYEIEQQKDPATGQIIQVRVFKPYECKYKDCFYKFKNENELQQHMKLHEFGKM